MASNKNRKREPASVAVLENIIIELSDGSFLKLDKTKVDVIDRKTKKPLFKRGE